MLSLIPMEAMQFAAFLEAASSNYAKDNIESGRWNASDALTLAREEMARLLPENERTSENYLFALRDADLSSNVGYIWYGPVVSGTKKIAFLYQIYIHAQFRRKGYGRQAMHAFENEALKTGHDAVALNVFASNSSAFQLYEAVGYRASSMTMRKDLQRRDA